MRRWYHGNVAERNGEGRGGMNRGSRGGKDEGRKVDKLRERDKGGKGDQQESLW